MSTQFRWFIVGIIALAAMVNATTELAYMEYVIAWGGAHFKFLSGAVGAYCIWRYIMRVDLSEMPLEQRVVAGTGMLIFMGLYGHAVSNGS